MSNLAFGTQSAVSDLSWPPIAGADVFLNITVQPRRIADALAECLGLVSGRTN